MNSFIKTIKLLAMALILLLTLTGYVTGEDSVPALLTDPDPPPPVREKTSQKDTSARKIALSGAAELFKDTQIGKNLNQYRKRLIRNFRFEYRKTFSHEASALGKKNIPQQENGKKESLKSVSFSGELDPNLSPVFEFNSRLNIIDFSSSLHLIDHEMECDISSRPVNDFLGGRAAIGLRSDGEKTEALIRFKFDLGP